MGARNGTLGLGVGWRPELAFFIERRSGLGFVELMAEAIAGGVRAGRQAFLAGRIPRRSSASASSPVGGLVGAAA